MSQVMPVLVFEVELLLGKVIYLLPLVDWTDQGENLYWLSVL